MNLNIALPSDNNYVQHLLVSLISLFESNKTFDDISVYVLDSGINESNKFRILNLGQKYNRKIFFLSLKDKLKNLKTDFHIPNTFSISSYSRLFLAEIIDDESVDRIIYADSDSLFLDSLEEAMIMDLGDNDIAGVEDHMSDTNKLKTGIDVKSPYVNAGFLVLNLKNWKKNGVTQKFLNFLCQENGNVFFHDQGIINKVFEGNIKILHPKYNVMTSFFDFKNVEKLKTYYDVKNYYDQNIIDEALKNPIFLHFTPSFSKRPWVLGCRHPLKNKYIYYAKKLEPNNLKIDRDSRALKHKFAEYLFWIIGPKFYKYLFV